MHVQSLVVCLLIYRLTWKRPDRCTVTVWAHYWFPLSWLSQWRNSFQKIKVSSSGKKWQLSEEIGLCLGSRSCNSNQPESNLQVQGRANLTSFTKKQYRHWARHSCVICSHFGNSFWIRKNKIVDAEWRCLGDPTPFTISASIFPSALRSGQSRIENSNRLLVAKHQESYWCCDNHQVGDA